MPITITSYKIKLRLLILAEHGHHIFVLRDAMVWSAPGLGFELLFPLFETNGNRCCSKFLPRLRSQPEVRILVWTSSFGHGSSQSSRFVASDHKDRSFKARTRIRQNFSFYRLSNYGIPEWDIRSHQKSFLPKRLPKRRDMPLENNCKQGKTCQVGNYRDEPRMVWKALCLRLPGSSERFFIWQRCALWTYVWSSNWKLNFLFIPWDPNSPFCYRW